MPRLILPETLLHDDIRDTVGEHFADTVDTVKKAVDTHDVVVVGMAQNPVVKKARKTLDGQGVAFHYIEYGSYLSEWRRRTSIKMWTGWPTFPMIFVKGVLIGGQSDLAKLIESDRLRPLLDAPRKDGA